MKNIKMQPFKEIGEDWFLITAGTKDNFNTMTASWGNIGVLWNKNVAIIYIRPSRYTLEFVDSNDCFTMSFFDGDYRKELSFCGANSGRDVDKVKATGLSPVFSDDVVYFAEAKRVFKCKKIYQDRIKPESFLDKSIDYLYSKKDYHIMYIAEIVEVVK